MRRNETWRELAMKQSFNKLSLGEVEFIVENVKGDRVKGELKSLVFEFMIETGMKMREILNLTWNDVECENKKVKINGKKVSKVIYRGILKNKDESSEKLFELSSRRIEDSFKRAVQKIDPLGTRGLTTRSLRMFAYNIHN